jgi:hypothetical protein
MSATAQNIATATVPTILAPVIAALASLPARATFDETPQGKVFAGMDSATRETLAGIISAARQQWEAANLANPYEESAIACAHLLASSVPAASLGSVIDDIRSRYFALSGLRNITDKEIGIALQEGKGETFDLVAQVYARAKLAKDTVSTAEAVRLARLSPNSYGAVNKWLGAGVSVLRKGEDGKDVSYSVDGILAPAARKWAKANGLDVIPAPKVK